MNLEPRDRTEAAIAVLLLAAALAAAGVFLLGRYLLRAVLTAF